MSTDPFGPDSPLGDDLPNPETSSTEAFGGDADFAAPGDDAGFLASGEEAELEPEELFPDEAASAEPPFGGFDDEFSEGSILSEPSAEDFGVPLGEPQDDGLLDLDAESIGGLDDFAAEYDASLQDSSQDLPQDPLQDSFSMEAPEPLSTLEPLEPLQPLEPLEPMAETESFLDVEETEELQSLESLPALQSLEDLEPGDPAAEPTELGLVTSDGEELAAEWDLDASEEDDGWLMDFELEEDAFDDGGALAPAAAAEPREFAEEAELEPESELEPRLRPVDAKSAWLGRALLAAVSVFLGVVGARFLPFGKEQRPEVKPRVAQVDPTPQPTPSEPVVTQPEPTAVVEEPAPPVVVTTDPEPTPPAPRIEDSTPPQVEIDWQEGQGGPDSRLARPTDSGQPPFLPDLGAEELGERLREATPAELSNIWPGPAIPLEAISGSRRLLTPNVGRVRVVLASDEVFEGSLYAVGQKRVWIETQLGRMALLDWQIDRVEHILTREGTAALGDDGSQDLAGLQRVRVSTAGGVFYGKLLAQDEEAVTLVTDSGGRITLRGAHVEPAGRSATHLVDSSGAIEEPEDAQE